MRPEEVRRALRAMVPERTYRGALHEARERAMEGQKTMVVLKNKNIVSLKDYFKFHH